MAHFKPYSYNEVKRLEFCFKDLLKPNTIEYAIHYVVDHEIDRSVFESRYRNDTGGAPAYDPAILLKIVLYAYACGVISSRRIAKSCRDNIIFMALAAGAQPHFTTIAHFVSSMHKEIKQVFLDVLSACEAQGLIGHEVLALDGCKLSSNAQRFRASSPVRAQGGDSQTLGATGLYSLPTNADPEGEVGLNKRGSGDQVV